MGAIIEIAGWVGAALILGAYVLVTRKGVSLTYQVMNFFGAIGVVINSAYHHAWPGMALNACWTLVAIYGMFVLRKPAQSDI